MSSLRRFPVFALLAALAGCGGGDDGRSMREVLAAIRERSADENPWLGDRDARALRTRAATLGPQVPGRERWKVHVDLARAESRLGNEQAAIDHLTRARELLPELRDELAPQWLAYTLFRLGTAWLRVAESDNCVRRNNAASCILPLSGEARHRRTEAATSAIDVFGELLRALPEGSPDHLRTRWLLNIAYMTIGAWPDDVPEAWRIAPETFASEQPFPRFPNRATALQLDTFDLSGGVAVEDFTGDGSLDLFVSTIDTAGQLRFFVNEGDGSFTERTEEAGLVGLYGGLNLNHADYDNDGDPDLFVMRGAWFGKVGRHPNSLLRNDGDGTFTDVSFAMGIAGTDYPTQCSAWADYDGDGDLDLFVGNEHHDRNLDFAAPSQLFRNDGGTFTDVAAEAGVENMRFAKGASWGDYDDDGDPDLYVSNLEGANRLYRNDGDGTFTDVAAEAGVEDPRQSFPTWFWDYDNDGHLDLFVSTYRGEGGALASVAASYLGLPVREELPRLYRGTSSGGFEDVTAEVRLDRYNLPMGANYGDLDNDGWLDFYLGTGYPDYEAIMPNVMYRNDEGRAFRDVTLAGGFGHLQKGHGVAFADFDNDGDEDVFEQMGGAFPGDRFHNALYVNPGFDAGWIGLRLVGTRSNRSAVGAKIRVETTGRTIRRHVTSGGSFGANPLRRPIGLGGAARVERLEITWPSGEVQQLTDLDGGRYLKIVEGDPGYEVMDLPLIDLGG